MTCVFDDWYIVSFDAEVCVIGGPVVVEKLMCPELAVEFCPFSSVLNRAVPETQCRVD